MSEDERHTNGDFAKGEREAPIPDVEPDFARGGREEPRSDVRPDFARGERTRPVPDEEPDFARGERRSTNDSVASRRMTATSPDAIRWSPAVSSPWRTSLSPFS